MGRRQRKIANAIPTQLMSDAIAAIGPAKQKIKIIQNPDGSHTRIPVVDDQGDPVMQPGGFSDLATVSLAFDAIKDDEDSPVRLRGAYNYAKIGSATDFNTANAFNESVDSAVTAGDLPGWLGEALNAEGIKFDSKLKNKLESLIGKHDFTQASINNVFNADMKTGKTFPRLKLGHVQEAIQMRSKGEV